MKTLALGVFCFALLQPLTACTPSTAPRGALDVHPRFEELSSQVPGNFSDARKWNQARICPEGSVLSPFTRYNYEPGQNSHGFKYYYGRSCDIKTSDEDETAGRKLASADPQAAAPPSVTLLPHGPYIWWYQSGKPMEIGSFDHGTLALGSSQFEPDGKTPFKE